MKILLTAVNAKYIHSNPAIYCLQSYSTMFQENIQLAEYTINQNFDEVLRAIAYQKPDVLAFSCYIWNISMVEALIREYKKIDPTVDIWLGGPEVSYDATRCLKRIPQVTGIMIGEGEQTFQEVVRHYVTKEIALGDVAGIAYRTLEGTIVTTEVREPIDFRRLPFLYEKAIELKEFQNRIIYYETSRGCPFSCSYCLSSIDKRVRFRDLDLVDAELQLFLDKRVPQVKFIDRTFNCNRRHAMHIWEFIKEHDNGITNFHFEIAADLLDEEEIELLASLRPGLVQLEIGVQTTNDKTITAIRRRMNLDLVKQRVAAVKKAKNIHQHLDLIAGLPYEDYETFQTSFDDVYRMHPDQLQLGFLKVLKGSYMEEKRLDYGIEYHSEPPYEVLYTNWLPYHQLCQLKDIEDMVEVYYNSGQFSKTIAYLEHLYQSPFLMYEQLAQYYRSHNLFGVNHARIKRYEILREFCSSNFSKDQVLLVEELMMFDLYLREKVKSRPVFAAPYEEYKKLYKHFLTNKAKEYEIGEQVHIEHFTYDVQQACETGELIKNECFIVFDYTKEKNLFAECNYQVFQTLV